MEYLSKPVRPSECNDVRTSEMCGHVIVDVIRAKRRTCKLRMTLGSGDMGTESGGILPFGV